MTFKVEFENSWADTKANAEAQFGEAGRVVACLRHGENKGSKGMIVGCIEEAGYSFEDLLRFFHLPYSSVGLSTACRLQADAIEDGRVTFD